MDSTPSQNTHVSACVITQVEEQPHKAMTTVEEEWDIQNNMFPAHRHGRINRAAETNASTCNRSLMSNTESDHRTSNEQATTVQAKWTHERNPSSGANQTSHAPAIHSDSGSWMSEDDYPGSDTFIYPNELIYQRHPLNGASTWQTVPSNAM